MDTLDTIKMTGNRRPLLRNVEIPFTVQSGISMSHLMIETFAVWTVEGESVSTLTK